MRDSPAVELKGLKKVFGEVVANADIHLEVRAGSIHAVIGENGAGKSTAMKLLYGMYHPDEGEIFVDGFPRQWRSPRDAIAAGIGMVHQHFMLAGPYTALENILLGIEPFLPADRVRARAKLEHLSQRYGLKVDFDERIENLSVGEQQRIEILKLLYQDARILILDEPTAVLTPQETEELFSNLKKLCSEGKTVLLITHKLKEVMAIADRATVFRAGRVVGHRETSKTNVDELAELMVGRKVTQAHQNAAGTDTKPGVAILELNGLSVDTPGRSHLHGVTFQVCAGEIVGIAGVEGNGQSELLHLLTQPGDYTRHSEGSIRYFGREVLRVPTSAAQIRSLGVGLIPEDRHQEGLLLGKSVRDNFLLGLQRLKKFQRYGFFKRNAIAAATEKAIDEYDVRPRSTEVRVHGLSGGNQQKLIIAREFERAPKLLIAAQPTRGVDVGAIESIHDRIRRARDLGAGVLLVSSELDEILALSDRILVMYAGKVAASFERGQATERELGLRMGGASS